MEQLRLCPFCGSDAVLEDLGGAGTAGRYFVRCPKCKVAQDSLWATKQTAIKRWNKRFPADGTGQHGKWLKYPGEVVSDDGLWGETLFDCSNCGHTVHVATRFCSKCGAKNDEVVWKDE